MKFQGGLKMRVDVSLCGSIPRSEMQFCSSNSRGKGRGPSATTGKKNTTATQPISMLADHTSRQPLPHVILDKKDGETKPLEPPSWAVPARGEARLEPVCDSIHTHSPVDLTTRTCIRFGRSQSSDVILHHCNSSRRHAMIFHHPNGNCYVVDCGSVHGTYVNGVRVRSIASQDKSNSNCTTSSNQSKVVPHRVKKGSLIRFGGHGAPTYILKSFSLGFEELVKDLTRPDIITCDGRNIVEDEATNQPSELSPEALVTLNTRINSMSRRYMNSFPATSIAMASAKLLMPKNTCCFSQQLKKRTRALSDFGSFDELDQQAKKKMKPSNGSTTTTTTADSTTLEVINTDAASPDLAIISPVPTEELIDFSHVIDRPIVSPNPLDTFEHSNDSFEEVRNNLKDFFVLPPLTLPTKKKSVRFSEEPPKLFYPPTPPASSVPTTSDEKTSPCEDETLNNNDSNVP